MTTTHGAALLEREREIALLADELETARAGTGRLVVVEGAPGIGKSRLLAATAELAASTGVQVLTARGSEIEREFGFGLVRQLFEPVLRADGPARDRLLGGAAGLAGSLLLGAPGEAAPPDAGMAILHSLYWFLANLADFGPVALVVDDAQWGDQTSLGYLRFLCPRIADLPVLLVVATRPEPDGMLGAVLADQSTTIVQPGPLSGTAVRHLVESELGTAEDAFVSACAEASGGNPFYLTELLRGLSDERVRPVAGNAARAAELGPATVRRAVLQRVADLPRPASAYARALAVLGDGAGVNQLAACAGVTPDAAVAAEQALVETHLVAAGARATFAHPIVRSAILADFSATQLAAEHARAADVLADLEAPVEQVAAHLLASAPAGNAAVVGRLRSAARQAMARGAPDAAADYLTRALAEPPAPDERGEVLADLGMAEGAVQRPESVAHLAEAQARLAVGPRRAQVGLVLARLLGYGGQFDAAIAAASSALEGLGADEREFALFLDAFRVGVGMLGPSGRSPLPAERLAELARLAGDTPAERSVLANLAQMHMQRCDPRTVALDLAERAHRGAGVTLTDAVDGLAPMCLVSAFGVAGKRELAIEITTKYLYEAQRSGSALWATQMLGLRAIGRWEQGALADAESDARTALAVGRDAFGLVNPLAYASLVYALIERGEVSEAAALTRDPDLPPADDGSAVGSLVHTAAGRVELALGHAEHAWQHFAAARDRLAAHGSVNPIMATWQVYGPHALAALDRHEEAVAVIDTAIAAAERAGAPYGRALCLHSAAMLGDEPDVDRLREAEQLAADGQSQLLHAQIMVDLGAALRRRGQRREARELLAPGHELALGCQAVPLADRAAVELAAAGARPRKVERTGLESLTPSERRIAELAAQGATNREIAQALFVTEKTVEKHLGNVFAKLGISSRVVLATRMVGGQ
jgi:DNA-binding CsgD family transcriptional regulator/tetratricopeptide (TPR) repeat protein